MSERFKCVGVIGAGAWGTALAQVATFAGHKVTLQAREPEVVAAINEDGTNGMFLPGVRIMAGIGASNDLAFAVNDSEFVLLAPPAQHMRAVTTALRSLLPDGIPVVSCSKGIERGSLALMPELLAETLPQARIAVLSGPSFAREIASSRPSVARESVRAMMTKSGERRASVAARIFEMNSLRGITSLPSR